MKANKCKDVVVIDCNLRSEIDELRVVFNGYFCSDGDESCCLPLDDSVVFALAVREMREKYSDRLARKKFKNEILGISADGSEKKYSNRPSEIKIINEEAIFDTFCDSHDKIYGKEK